MEKQNNNELTVIDLKNILINLQTYDVFVTKHFQKRLIERDLDISSHLMHFLTQKNVIIKEEDDYNVFSISFYCEKISKKVTIICRINESKQLILITIY